MQIKFTRKVDELGRIVLPMDVRKHMGFEKDQILEITIQEDAILLRKAGVTCALWAAVSWCMPEALTSSVTRVMKRSP
ncbi:AbrB/MazE/SpoVT family DNA-binding domain-containing protein [Zongyangia sp. HA2173]|uniref:AbrB/MazE/SpoVT family DNA-binding domain-containing protein n=1 Tax=Zongyangia sp. HA2173 TaxID=3133035 RepID=UPI003163BBDE